MLIVGKPGISKSMGFLLAWYLSSISTAYRFKYISESKRLS